MKPSNDQLTFEMVPTEWFDPNAIRLPGYRVGRVNYGKGRSYIRIQDGQLEDPFRLYTSLTTAIGTCAPMERGLLEWYCKLGLVEAERYTAMSAHYGTLMHIAFGKFLQAQFFDLGTVNGIIGEYVHEHSLVFPEIKQWPERLRRDLAAFAQFCYECEVKPLGIEYVLLSNRGFGTLIDLVCKIKIEEEGYYGEVYKSGPRKGEPKKTFELIERTAIINFKSGRHGFYRSNGIQAICEAQLFEENFPDVQIDLALNWAPKEWESFPSWSLKNWKEEGITQSEVDAVLALAEARFGVKAMDKKFVALGGVAYMGRPVNDNVTIIGVHEYCKQVYSDYL